MLFRRRRVKFPSQSVGKVDCRPNSPFVLYKEGRLVEQWGCGHKPNGKGDDGTRVQNLLWHTEVCVWLEIRRHQRGLEMAVVDPNLQRVMAQKQTHRVHQIPLTLRVSRVEHIHHRITRPEEHRHNWIDSSLPFSPHCGDEVSWRRSS